MAVVGGLSTLFVVSLASPAFAHAVLLETTPGEGAVLTSAPTTVSLRYDEQVSVNAGSVRVYNSHRSRVDTGMITKPSADVVEVGLRSHLGDGVYVVTWRVISADAHPVEGAFAFQVGPAGNATAPAATRLAQNLLHDQRGDQIVGAVYGIVRGILFAGIALLVGAAAFGVFIWSGARPLRRTAHLLWAGWILTAAATLAEVLIQGVYGAGLALADVFRADLIRGVLATQFGHMAILRLALLVLAIPLLRMLLRSPVQRHLSSWVKPTTVLFGVVVALTVALSGHAHTGRLTEVAVPDDVIHILAMCVWLGGLAVLAYAVFPGRRLEELRVVVPPFSRTAMACVVALVVTGSFQAWRQVGSIQALRSTTYGQVLVIKLVVVLALIVFGALSRQIVGYLFSHPKLRTEERRISAVAGGADDDPPSDGDNSELDAKSELLQLRRSVFVELLIGIVVVAVTAVLVNAAPANIAAAQRNSGATGVTLKSSQVWVDFSVVPGVAPGANSVHVSVILPTGRPISLEDLTATIDDPSRHIAPLEIPLRYLGSGHYLSPGFTIPFSGNWRITAHALLSQFDEVTLAGIISVS